MPRIDLTGEKIGLLTVKRPAPDITKESGRVYAAWYCDCECGTKDYITTTERLRNPKCRSCGCLRDKHQFKKKLNKYDLSGDYGIGYSSKNEEFYFDLEDCDRIKGYCWHITKDGYIITNSNNNDYFLMHRLVMDAPQGYDVDHINHNKYDNRKSNLRITTTMQNCSNRKLTNKYGANGIVRTKDGWTATIGHNWQLIYLGHFHNLEDAIKARKEAEEKYYGDFSYQNSMRKAGVL